MGLFRRIGRLAGMLAVVAAVHASSAVAQDNSEGNKETHPSIVGPLNDCLGNGQGFYDNNRRIEACTALLGSAFSNPMLDSEAYAARALAYSLKGLYDRSIEDYDAAIKLNPSFAAALNNRAWAYFRSGRPNEALPDVEKSLRINPGSQHAWDTRAHIRQSFGDFAGAMRDYEMAIHLGGEKMIKIYQCGLAERGLYKGRRDGIYSTEVKSALETCVRDRNCDPLPADEQCREATS